MKTLLRALAGLFLAALLLPSLGPCAAADAPLTSPRSDALVNGAWHFHRGEAPGAQGVKFVENLSWHAINSLPHTWNNLDGQDGGNNYYRGFGWYRTLTPVPAATGKRYFLQFDGANLVADVWVNGVYLGRHVGGYSRFRFDATQAIVPGAPNLIAVRVDNTAYDLPPISADFTFFGGLYRNVHLVTLDAAHVQMLDYGSPGVYLSPAYSTATGAWTVSAVVKVKNDAATARPLQVHVNLVDADNAVVGTITAGSALVAGGSEWDATGSAKIANPHLWNGKSAPYLYRAEVEVRDLNRKNSVVSDAVSQTFGLRTFRVDPSKGFVLNGVHYDLHGVNKHQDRLDKGWAVSDADSDEDFRLIDEIGATAVRLCHYEHSEHEYDLADRYGLVAWAEIPLVNQVSANADPTEFNRNAQQQLVELIRQNYNHPAICFWSIANEITARPPNPQPLLTALNGRAHAEDPTRLTTLASLSGAAYGPSSALTDVLGVNQYYGWYYANIGGRDSFGPWAKAYHKYRPNRAFALSEYGAGASVFWHSDRPVKGDHTEEYQNLYHEAHWAFLKTAPYVWGTFVWNMFDFAVDGRDEGDTAGRNDKGLVTYDRRTKKDAFFWYKANWSATPFVHITGHTYTNRNTRTADVKVYANTQYVSLKVNGVPARTKSSRDHIFLWKDVPLTEGPNTIQAFGSDNGADAASTDTVTWAMTPDITINAAGRLPYTDADGTFWDVDRYVTGGTRTRAAAPIYDTPDQALYQTYRYGTFTYTLPVQPGLYTLRLKFDEPYWKAAGKRVFSVTANGTPLLTRYDVFAEVGANTAVEKAFRINVRPKQQTLTLKFTPSVDQAMVCAISALPDRPVKAPVPK